MQDAMVTTALSLPGYKIVRTLGVVRGLTVRSRSIIGNFFGGIQSIFGGNITIYTNLCEQARETRYPPNPPVAARPSSRPSRRLKGSCDRSATVLGWRFAR